MSMEGRGNNCEFGGGGLTDASLEGGGVTCKFGRNNCEYGGEG